MVPRWYPPIGRPIGTPPRDTHITWPWRLRPAVSYQSSGAASAPGGNTPRALYGAGADGHPEAPDRRPLGACPYRRQCAECSPSKFIDGLFQTVMGGLQIDGTVDFMTYVNGFSALKWRQYAGLDEVCLDLVLDGSGHVRIFSVEHGSLEPVQIKQVPFSPENGLGSLAISVCLKNFDLIGFSVSSEELTTATLVKG